MVENEIKIGRFNVRLLDNFVDFANMYSVGENEWSLTKHEKRDELIYHEGRVIGYIEEINAQFAIVKADAIEFMSPFEDFTETDFDEDEYEGLKKEIEHDGKHYVFLGVGVGNDVMYMAAEEFNNRIVYGIYQNARRYNYIKDKYFWSYDINFGEFFSSYEAADKYMQDNIIKIDTNTIARTLADKYYNWEEIPRYKIREAAGGDSSHPAFSDDELDEIEETFNKFQMDDLINQIENWNVNNNIEDLKDLLTELNEFLELHKQFRDMYDMDLYASLPLAESRQKYMDFCEGHINSPVWSVDSDGNVLAGDEINEIVTAEEIEAHEDWEEYNAEK